MGKKKRSKKDKTRQSSEVAPAVDGDVTAAGDAPTAPEPGGKLKRKE